MSFISICSCYSFGINEYIIAVYIFNSTIKCRSGSQRKSQNRSNVNWTTTLGLVVHAAADGIAMGAAAATHQVRAHIHLVKEYSP